MGFGALRCFIEICCHVTNKVKLILFSCIRVLYQEFQAQIAFIITRRQVENLNEKEVLLNAVKTINW